MWPGTAAHTLRFANGTNLTVETTASWPTVNGAMNYSDGESLYQAACLHSTQSNLGTYPGKFSSVPTYSLPFSGPASFPEPVVRHSNDLIRGYYLDRTLDQDVAVLQVPTFRLGNEASAFARTAVEFVKLATTDRKAKVVIDLSGNSGGDIVQGFNLFRAFFPDQPIYSATRFRATELIDLIGQVFSNTFDPTAELAIDPPVIFQNAVTPDQQHNFASWKELYGPNKISKANLSGLYANFNFSAASGEDDPISGFGGIPLDLSTQPFKAENIVIVCTPNFSPSIP